MGTGWHLGFELEEKSVLRRTNLKASSHVEPSVLRREWIEAEID